MIGMSDLNLAEAHVQRERFRANPNRYLAIRLWRYAEAIDEIDRLRAERDELLAACEVAYDWVHWGTRSMEETDDTLHKAIAKARGES